MQWQYTEGNYSCDCNRLPSLARAYQREEPEVAECRSTLVLKRLTMIRPDASEVVLFDIVRDEIKKGGAA